MTRIVKCPECGQPVTAGVEADRSALVACPICDGQFTPGEAVELADEWVQASPPGLVPLWPADTSADVGQELSQRGSEPCAVAEESPVEPLSPPESEETPSSRAAGGEMAGDEEGTGGRGGHEAGLDEAASGAVEAATDQTDDPLVQAPGQATEFPLSQLVIAATGQPLGKELAAVVARQVRSGSPEPDGAGASPFAFLSQAVDEAPRFDFAPDQQTDWSGQIGWPLADRQRRRKKSWLRELVGIVLGGLAGLAVGYYVLNYFGKHERFNFLNVYLPGVQHTVKYRPEWWPRWGSEPSDPSQPAAEEEDPGGGGAGRRDSAGLYIQP